MCSKAKEEPRSRSLLGAMATLTDMEVGVPIGQKTVLVVFKNRRRPISFQGSTDPQTEKRNLLAAVESIFLDVISSGEGTSGVGGRDYFLQTENAECGSIEIMGHVEDHETVFLETCSSDPGKAQVSINCLYRLSLETHGVHVCALSSIVTCGVLICLYTQIG